MLHMPQLGKGYEFMRSVFAAFALGLLSCGSAAASSFEVIGENQVAPAITSGGSSIIMLGEPDPAASKPVDTTETASVDPRSDAAPRARPTAAMAAADWARVSATKSPSLLYFGEPDPNDYKLPNQEAAASDPHAAPMVMRGGIEGDRFVTPQTAATTTDGELGAPAPEGDPADGSTGQADATAPGQEQTATGNTAEAQQPVAEGVAEPAANQPN